MTEIEYEVREQDLIAFNEHQLKNSESLQRSLRRHQAVVPGIIFVISLFLWFYYRDTVAAAYVAFVALAWGLLIPLYLRTSLRRQIQRLYSEEEKACVLGHYKLRVEPKALVEVGPEGKQTRVDWPSILRIEGTKKHAFIFLTLDTALIIPRATVKSGDIHQFFRDVDERIEAAA